MTVKLFAIGDSITQGFMSGAAARSDLAYSAIMARAMGMKVGSAPTDDFRIPTWPCGGLPINLELVARRIQKKIGANIDVWDWPQLAASITGYLDQVEDCYERGEARADIPFGQLDYFHNAGIQGYDVADAWLVTPALCREQIKAADRKEVLKDGLFSYPSASFYRTALNVLDPQRNPANANVTVLDLLEQRATTDGVENLCLWLGANNALGTVVSLNVRATNGPHSNYSREMSRVERDDFNLWGPKDFEDEYEELIDRTMKAMENNKYADWKVFVATVPAVSVAPLMSGVGDAAYLPDPFGVIKGRTKQGAKYFRYYTYFLFDYDFAYHNKLKLTQEQVYQIDGFIAQYRETIKRTCAAANRKLGAERFIVVDICETLLKAAYKRNDGVPIYDWPKEMLSRFPMVDTRFHHAEKGDTHLEQGGIFGMDGIHPSAIGQGLIAHEFLKSLNAARGSRYQVDWNAVYASDDLYNAPIQLMGSIRAKAEHVAQFLIWATSLKGRGPRAR